MGKKRGAGFRIVPMMITLLITVFFFSGTGLGVNPSSPAGGKSPDMSGMNSGSEELRPIRGIIPTDNTWLEWLLIAAGVLLVLATAYFLYKAYRKWRRKKELIVPADPPHIRAEKDMGALLKEGIFEKGFYKEFYFRFTEIIKRYVGEVRQVPALECTTEELARMVKDEDRVIIDVLKYADLVKFADQAPDPVRKDEEVSSFFAYIDVTATKAGMTEDKDKGGTRG